MYHIIAYYHFSVIGDPARFCADHRRACRRMNLKGRVYLAGEGINGTLAGAAEDIGAYKDFLHSIPGFAATDFKHHVSEAVPFDRLTVKVRPEIVTLKVPLKGRPDKDGAQHLTPAEWRRMMESGEDYVMIDVRNDYETAIGHFKGALLPPVKNFYDFPQWVEKTAIPKHKKILMYCTGGIRCEKFSVFMKEKGYTEMYQLQGGILNYARQEGGRHFAGKCFVFDDRLSVPVDENRTEPISRCELTGVLCDTYINCANFDCNRLFICSEEAAVRMKGCCSDECMRSEWRRPFNAEDIYAPSRRWHNYYGEKRPQGLRRVIKSSVSQ